MSDGVRCMWMRGGSSKGAFFLADDLPADAAARDAFLLRMMGSPDPRQIDGMGGADPLTSKVAVVSRSAREGVDVDYLFLQVFVDQAIVTDAQPCGNILAGVGPAAIERGLVAPVGDVTSVRIHMLNTGEIATAHVATPRGRVSYAGDTAIDGVPGAAAAIPLMFENIAGSMTGALLPTGNAVDVIDGIEANQERCRFLAEASPSIVTPLNKAIGYEAAAKIAKHAVANKMTVREATIALGYVENGSLTEEQLDTALDVLTGL